MHSISYFPSIDTSYKTSTLSTSVSLSLCQSFLFMRLIQSTFLMVLISLAGFSPAYANDANPSHCAVGTEKNGTLRSARLLFQSNCASYTLVDCDPIKGGGWECSSAVLGSRAPGRVNVNNTPQQDNSSVASTLESTADNTVDAVNLPTPTPTVLCCCDRPKPVKNSVCSTMR